LPPPPPSCRLRRCGAAPGATGWGDGGLGRYWLGWGSYLFRAALPGGEHQTRCGRLATARALGTAAINVSRDWRPKLTAGGSALIARARRLKRGSAPIHSTRQRPGERLDTATRGAPRHEQAGPPPQAVEISSRPVRRAQLRGSQRRARADTVVPRRRQRSPQDGNPRGRGAFKCGAEIAMASSWPTARTDPQTTGASTASLPCRRPLRSRIASDSPVVRPPPFYSATTRDRRCADNSRSRGPGCRTPTAGQSSYSRLPIGCPSCPATTRSAPAVWRPELPGSRPFRLQSVKLALTSQVRAAMVSQVRVHQGARRAG